MKRTLILLTTFALVILISGCDQDKSPAAPEYEYSPEAEAILSSAQTDSILFTLEDEASLNLEGALAGQGAASRIVVPDDHSTIQAAVDAASPGARIIVKESGSPYNENVFIDKPGIRIIAKGKVTLNGSFLVRANDVGIEKFHINVVSPPGGPDGGIDIGNVSGVRVRNNTITGINRGIFLNGSTGCLVERNTCTGLAADGILLYFSANGNRITGNTSTGNAHGLVIVASNNNLVNDNNFSDNVSFGNSSGIHLASGDGNRVKKNICNGNLSAGISLSEGSNNIFGPGNTANSNGSYGISLSGSDNSVYRNDFHCNQSGDIRDVGTNNVFSKNRTGPLPECL